MNDTVTTLQPDFSPRQVAQPGNLERICRRYLQHLEIRGYARATVVAYRIDLEQFVGFMRGRDVTSIYAVTRTAIEDFADALLHGENCGPRTVHRKIVSVRSLFRYACERDIIRMGDNPLRHPLNIRFPRHEVHAPSEEAILAMIEAIPADTIEGRRDKALFLLMYDAALRVSAVCGLNLGPPDYGVSPRGVVYYQPKGAGPGEVATASIEPATVAQVEDWLERRQRYVRRDSPPALFLGRCGTRLSRVQVLNRCKLHGARVGMPNLHPHLLRHRRGREIFRHVGPTECQQQLGHKHLSTTLDEYQGEAQELVRHRIRTEAPIGGRQ